MAEKEESQNPTLPIVTEKEEQSPSTAATVEEPAVTDQKEEQPPHPPPPPASAVENRSLAAMLEKEASAPEKVKEDVASAAAADSVDETEKADQNKQQQQQQPPPPPPRLLPTDGPRFPQSLISFKEESNVVSDLSDFERKALLELKQLVQESLNNRQFASPAPAAKEEAKEKQPSSDVPKTEVPFSESDKSTEIKPPQEQQPQGEEATPPPPAAAVMQEEVSIWGVPLLKDDRSDVILLKFLRARDFKVRDAFVMIKNTIQWRKDFGIEALLNEDLGDDLEKVVFMHGFDREGHPVCYNVYGEFQNKQLYYNTFADDEKRMKFLRWRIQFLERSIRKLNFRPGGVSTIFQVNDLKNSPGPAKHELRIATKQALQLFQDNYPEFVCKQVFINVPWWYLAFYTMISPFMTQRTKTKFVFAGPSKSPETLFKYISPEHVPIQYGGLSVDYCDCNPEFTIDDPVTEITVKPSTKQNVEILVYEKCTIVWEIRVVGWEVSYGAEFVPDAKDKYTIIMQKPTKFSPTDEPVVCHRFKVDELGKILLTVDNPTAKKKKLLYRFKVEPF